MKKILSLVLVLTMLLALTACGSKNAANDEVENETVVDTDTDADTVENDADAEAPETDDTENDAQDETNDSTSTGESLGTILRDSFTEIVNNGTTDVNEIAEELIANDAIEFSPVTAEVEEGWLQGFDTDITGFTKAVCFMPMIGTIPFVGYVFELDSADSVPSFIETLEANANPAWNICTEADETVIDSVDNLVFFVMCPAGE